jgi:hypothetical protein
MQRNHRHQNLPADRYAAGARRAMDVRMAAMAPRCVRGSRRAELLRASICGLLLAFGAVAPGRALSQPGVLPSWLVKPPAAQSSLARRTDEVPIPDWLVKSPGPPRRYTQQTTAPLVEPQPRNFEAPCQLPSDGAARTPPRLSDLLVKRPAAQMSVASRQNFIEHSGPLSADEAFKQCLSAPPAATTFPAPLLGGGLSQPASVIALDEEASEVRLASFAKQQGTQNGNRGSGDEPTYGQRPTPTNNNLQFLRRQAVLLEPGDMQFDAGGVYTLFDNNIPVPVLNGNTLVNVVPGRVRRRLLYVPFGGRYGVTDRLQLFAFWPVGWANSQTSAIGTDEFTNRGGFGDLTAGANILACEGCGGSTPDTIVTLGFTAPTGDFTSPIFGIVPGSALSQGFWALQAQFLCISRYDPIVLFYGAGYRHLFQRSFDGSEFQAGDQWSYQFGVGFAANERVTLSTAFQGYYITDTYLNHQRVAGTNQEPLSLRFAVTIVRSCKIFEPFALIGMTDQAPAAQIGTIITWR